MLPSWFSLFFLNNTIKMFVYYNVIWIICIALLFASIFMLLKKRRTRNLMNNGNYATNNPNFVVDMNGRQNYPPPPPQNYAPPPVPHTQYPPPPTSSSGLEPPPPSYQDYSKDHRIPHLQ